MLRYKLSITINQTDAQNSFTLARNPKLSQYLPVREFEDQYKIHTGLENNHERGLVLYTVQMIF